MSFDDTCRREEMVQALARTGSDSQPPGTLRAAVLRPPGCRTGEGLASLLPYLAVTLASKARPGPPDSVERRARPRDIDLF